MIDLNEFEWNKLTIGERMSLLKLLRNGQKVSAIKHVRASTWMSLKEAKLFIESEWLWKKVVKSDPTRMFPRDELRAEVLRVVSDMFYTVADPDMLMKNKYETITESYMPKLMAICTED